MVTRAHVKYKLLRFWDNEFQNLDYVNEPFNDPQAVSMWRSQGFAERFTGDMCDMGRAQPTWNSQFVDIFRKQGWQDIGTSYYRMMPGTILPTHSDLYVKYIKMFGLEGREHTIRRAVIFLEDWQPGHYAEYQDQPFVNWCAGDVVEWTYDTPHMAANMGPTPRYTLQITGHV
jgi:hypothetical protein